MARESSGGHERKKAAGNAAFRELFVALRCRSYFGGCVPVVVGGLVPVAGAVGLAPVLVAAGLVDAGFAG